MRRIHLLLMLIVFYMIGMFVTIMSMQGYSQLNRPKDDLEIRNTTHHRPSPSPSPSPPRPPPTHSSSKSKSRSKSRSESKSENNRNNSIDSLVIVVLCYQRPHYLRNTLESLVTLRHVDRYPIVVSQDGYDQSTAAVALSFNISVPTEPSSRGDIHPNKLYLIHHPRVVEKDVGATHYVALHYKWMFDQIFIRYDFKYAIVIEEDMILSPDFLLYFETTRVLLDTDPTLWCISSWNDNAFSTKLFNHPRRIRRTDYFPGLGWMLRQSLWVDELSAKFPLDQWDHWMRVSSQSRGRECLFPEVSRNHNIGESGSTTDLNNFGHYVQSAQYAEKVYDFGDVGYLLHDEYKKRVTKLIARARWFVSGSELVNMLQTNGGLTNITGAVPAARVTTALSDLDADEDATDVLVVLYRNENFDVVAAALDVYTPRRGTHHGLQIFRLKSSANAAATITIVTANTRQPDFQYLPTHLRERPLPTFKAVRAAPATDCVTACQKEVPIPRRCDATQFDFINSCDALGSHFDCLKGCAYETGVDLPNFVSDSKHANFQRCLVTAEKMQCEGSHPATSRLCPCV